MKMLGFVRRIQKHPYIWGIGCFTVGALPQWVAAVWSMFSDKPMVPYFFSNINIKDLGQPEFSGFFITVPLAIVMFLLLYLKPPEEVVAKDVVMPRNEIGLTLAAMPREHVGTLADFGVRVSGQNMAAGIGVHLENIWHAEPLTGVVVSIIGLKIWSDTNNVFHSERQFHETNYFPIKIKGSDKLFLEEPQDYELITVASVSNLVGDRRKLCMKTHNQSKTVVFDAKDGTWRVELQVGIEEKIFTEYLYFSYLPTYDIPEITANPTY